MLSACKSALSATSSGEGLAGLRRAFRTADARTVISSLWSVPDTSTAKLMELFYDELWLELDRDDLSRWGAFVPSGDWR